MRAGSPNRWPGAWLAVLAAVLPPAIAAPPAPPVPSTQAPHPSASVVRVSGMTLEIRSGRVVVTDVEKGSPAERGGVKPLDIVLVVNERSLVDLDPISPQQILALLQYEQTPRTRMVLGRGTGTLSVDLARTPGETWTAPVAPAEQRVGVEAPLFSGSDLQGREVSLKDLRGRPVLLDFWSSTCPPCLKAVVPIRRIAEQYAGALTIVGVSLDDDRKAFEAFVYNQHLPGTQIFDGGGWGGPIARLYGVASIPHYVLLDAQGRLAATGDLKDLEAVIAGLAAAPR